MSIPAATSDPSRRLDIALRIKRIGTITFKVYDTNGAAYDIDSDTFELLIKTNQGERTNTIKLTEASGLSKLSNVITATFTASQTNIREGQYYWELYLSNRSKTWLSGYAYFHNGPFDGV